MAISYREKKPAYDGMRGTQYFEPDMKLLRKHIPEHELCKRKYLKPEKHQPEALWSLLDVVPKDDIVKNRRAWFKAQVKKKMNAIAKESGILTAQMERAETLEALEALYIWIKDVVEPVPEDVRATMMKLADSVYTNQKELLTVDPEKEKKDALAKTVKTLLETDLEKAPQSELAKFVRSLGDNLKTVPENMKAVTLRPILKAYVEKLTPQGKAVKLPPADNTEKEDAGGGAEKIEVPADLEKTNELKEENEDLKEELDIKEDEVSDLEDEKEELQDENEELQQQNKKLEEELGEQKKSEQPAAANSKSTKSTPASNGESSK